MSEYHHGHAPLRQQPLLNPTDTMTSLASTNAGGVIDVNTPLLSHLDPESQDSSYDGVPSSPPPAYRDQQQKSAPGHSPARSWLAGNAFSWTGILLLALAISLDAQTVQSLQTYALSSFSANGKLGILSSMQNFVTAAARPPIAILADSHGRFSSFFFSIVILTLGFIGLALSSSYDLFMLSQFAYATGQVGIQFMETVIVADTSSLPNRALATAMPMTPWMITVFTAAPIVEALVPDHWRLGYGIWAIIVPAASIPLLLSLYYRETRTHNHAPSRSSHKPLLARLKNTSNINNIHFDVTGFLVFTIGLAFILFSASSSSLPYKSTSTILGLTGALLLIIFCYYELHVARHPILALYLARDRTVAAGCLLAILLFGGFAIYQPYLYSYLVVARNESASTATNAGLVSLFVSVISGLIASAVVKFTKRYKWIMVLGILVRILSGVALLCYTTRESSIASIIAAQVLVGIGTGMGGLIVQVGVQAAVSARDIATACALYATASSIGSFIGDLVSSLMWSSMLVPRLESSLPSGAKSKAEEIANSIIVAQSFAMGTPERDAINDSYVAVIRVMQVTGILVIAVGLVVSFWMRDIDLDRPDPGEEGDD